MAHTDFVIHKMEMANDIMERATEKDVTESLGECDEGKGGETCDSGRNW